MGIMSPDRCNSGRWHGSIPSLIEEDDVMRYVPTTETDAEQKAIREAEVCWKRNHRDTRQVIDPAERFGHYFPSNAPSAH